MISIEKVISDSELHEVAMLAEKIWHEFFPAVISEEQIDYMVEKFQSYEAMKNQTESQGYYYLAVRCDGELCGYIGVKPESDSRFFLSKLYLRSDMRGKGIASEMMSRVFDEARSAGKKSVYLTVNKYNAHAVEVYRKKGFEVIDSVITDIGGGFVMDDYIMEYKL
ncbi:MAG: GNAT family N-acetyltransferase [Ruminococcus flavefaciens]|nr:GNAT family N-acetyltransferase [Ruminococcus flavefaciens]